MKPSIALQEHRAAIRSVVERYRARNARVFGSVVHGGDQEGSDQDILIYPTPNTTLMDVATIQVELEKLLRLSRFTLAIILGLGGVVVWSVLQPKPPKQEPAIQITDAGSVKAIQLHETSLSTATTVTTTAGIYQVRGGVSGTAGDEAHIEAKEVGTLGIQRSLCIQSSIKTTCYPLM